VEHPREVEPEFGVRDDPRETRRDLGSRDERRRHTVAGVTDRRRERGDALRARDDRPRVVRPADERAVQRRVVLRRDAVTSVTAFRRSPFGRRNVQPPAVQRVPDIRRRSGLRTYRLS
jgi:hypothetical protein